MGTPLTSGVMNLTVVETFVASQTVNNATTFRAYTITVDPPRPPISLTATVGRALFGYIAQDVAYPAWIVHLHHRCDGAARQRTEPNEY